MDKNDYPWLFRAADRASFNAQRYHFWGLKYQLGIFFTVGLLAAIPTWVQLTEKGLKGFAVVSAIALAFGLLLVGALREKRFDRRWFDSRAVAESVKTLAWRYMMRMPPFQIENLEVDQTFLSEVRSISSSRPSALGEVVGISHEDKSQITGCMRRVRQSPFDERKAYYLASRVAEERDWYYNKAESNRARSEKWYWAVMGIQGLALGCAVMRAGDFMSVSLVGILMTLAASLSAWTQARRHDELRTTYAVTAGELTTLEEHLALCTSEAQLQLGVENVEETISKEHMMWRARRSVAP